MRDQKRRRLEKKGWRVGTVAEFLQLSPVEEAYVEIRLRLAAGLRRRRKGGGLTQAELAKAVRSSQSRVAKMEAAEQMVSIDLLIRTLLALGTTPRELAQMISGRASKKAA